MRCTILDIAIATCVSLCVWVATAVAAGPKGCILKYDPSGAYDTGTPCTDAVAAYPAGGGSKNLIKLAGCGTGTKSVVVVLEKGDLQNLSIGGLTANVTFAPAYMTPPSYGDFCVMNDFGMREPAGCDYVEGYCRSDPTGPPDYPMNGFLFGTSYMNLATNCADANPNVIQYTFVYLEGGSPILTMNLPVLKIEFAGTNLTYGNSTTTLTFAAADDFFLANQIGNQIATTNINADVICESDVQGPVGGSISYTDGYYTSIGVPVSFATGTDASGYGAGSIMRRAAPFSVGLCGTFGAWNKVADATVSPYSDTAVSLGNCYQYSLKETDQLGNTTTTCTNGVNCSSLNTAKVTSTDGPLDCATYGDFSQNGQVNLIDAIILGGNFGRTGASPGDPPCHEGNADGDDKVDNQDLLILKNGYGSVPPSGGTPETTMGISPTVSISLLPTKTFLTASNTVAVDVMLNAAAGAGLKGADVFLVFASDTLSVSDIVVKTPPSGGEWLVTNESYSDASGSIAFGFVSTGAGTSDFNDSVATINFNVLRSATGAISFVKTPAANQNTSVFANNLYYDVTTSDLLFSAENTPPTAISFVNDGTGDDASFWASSTYIAANWATSSDPESGVTAFWYSLGTTSGASDAVAWTDAASGTTAAVGGLQLSDGAMYYFSVKAMNGAGLFNEAITSNGVRIDVASPTVAISTPLPGANISTSSGITGTATDTSLASWSLKYGPGTSPTSWKEIASGTNPFSNNAITTWNTGSLSGSYTLKLSATDFFGRTAQVSEVVNVGNTATISGTIPKNKWLLVSMPVEPVNASSTAIFGATGTYKVLRADPTAMPDPVTGQYVTPGALHAGYGFWIKPNNDSDLSYFYGGSLIDTTQNYSVPLKTGWNQIGTPFDGGFPWNQALVKYQGATYDMPTAANMNLISPVCWSYDGATNTWEVSDVYPIMASQTGYNVRAYKDVELLFGPGAGIVGGVARRLRPSWDYKFKISAQSVNSADTDNFVGAANTADAEYDPLDAEEPPITLNDKYTSLYFPRNTWKLNAGQYAADIRPLATTSGGAEEWTFSVDTNEVGQTVTLGWDNSSLPSSNFTFALVNLDTSERVNMAARSSYNYTATGTVKSTGNFKIEIVKLSVTSETRTLSLVPGWNLISVPLEPGVTAARDVLGTQLDIYQYLDGQYYASGTADIQTGAGYWVNVTDAKQIDIHGTPPAASINVPLYRGWNIIGNPFDNVVSWGDNITMTCTGRQFTLSQAVAAGMTDGRLYEYTGDSYGQSNSMEQWKGYFVKMAMSCEMVISR